MTTTEPLVTPIDAQDRRALKHADSVLFRMHRGQATVEAVKRGENTHDGFEQKHTIFCAGTVTAYQRDASVDHGFTTDCYSAFHSRQSAQFDPTLRTLLDRIRLGDTLTLAWTRGNDSENTRSIGWHRDELRLVITSDKGKREVYLVAVEVGPDNSARMVQRSR